MHRAIQEQSGIQPSEEGIKHYTAKQAGEKRFYAEKILGLPVYGIPLAIDKYSQ